MFTRDSITIPDKYQNCRNTTFRSDFELLCRFCGYGNNLDSIKYLINN